MQSNIKIMIFFSHQCYKNAFSLTFSHTILNRLWKNVSDAIATSDMHAATHEKYILEERQRNEAKERKAKMLEWMPRLFERDPLTGDWVYKFVE